MTRVENPAVTLTAMFITVVVWIYVVLLLVGAGFFGAARLGFGLAYWRAGTAEHRHYIRTCARIRRTWRRLARQLGLYLLDDLPSLRDRWKGRHRAEHPRIRTPRIQRIHADADGVIIDLETVPGVGLAEVATHTAHLADHWRVEQVQARRPAPGRIQLRATNRDPHAPRVISPKMRR
ncbi:hypothetical protein [Nocardia amamiensis]|uniref:hypothetical protein n=1 Tax=Nocardia amamiensis TaxID=404578 RepID=UPI00083591E1|nr:hypothetical protein [Nocardia amamiensis]